MQMLSEDFSRSWADAADGDRPSAMTEALKHGLIGHYDPEIQTRSGRELVELFLNRIMSTSVRLFAWPQGEGLA